MSPSGRAHTTSFSAIIKTVFFYRFRDIAGYLSKVADFNPSHLHLASPYGLPGNISRRFLASKN